MKTQMSLLVVLLAAGAFCPGVCGADRASQGLRAQDTRGVIWLEAEQFKQTGGWSNDPQFVEQMGSPFLLATGLGKPVEDAVTHVAVSVKGAYRLWVRARDWLVQHHPGRFQVMVGGKAAETIFGKGESDKWQWVDGGLFSLAAGDVEIRIHDLTGWWGRCDALVLAPDGGFRPADDLALLARQREACGGVSRRIQEPGPYDVVVVGGGLAGSAAAVAAARCGARTALIQDRPLLGGNASEEIEVAPQGDQTREPLDPRETGIIEEFEPRGGGWSWSKQMDRVVRTEPKLDLFLGTRATGAEKKGAEIVAIRAINTHTGRRFRFRGKIFVDSTGDGWVGYWAGAVYHHGREGSSEFGESLASGVGDTRTMGNTINRLDFRMRDKPVPFEAPPWAYHWSSPSDFSKDPVSPTHTSGKRPENFDNLEKTPGREPKKATAGQHQWWVEFGGMYDTIRNAEWIRDELLRINLGLWDYCKNHSPQFREANEKRELIWMNYVPGTRESRRLLGDYVLTQRDYAERIVHRDTVAYAGWGLDIHHPWGFFAPGNLYMSSFRLKASIPYRCLYSRNIPNLLMAGRDISVSHIALGSTRVMRTCCCIGQAAGTAAAIAVHRSTTPRGVYEQHLDELQDTLLRDGAYLMGRPNRDPEDLARTAKVAASSVARIRDPRSSPQGRPNGGVVHDLNVRRAVMFTAGANRLDGVELFLRSKGDKPVRIRAALRSAARLGDFSATEDIAAAEAAVPPGSAGWVSFPLRAELVKGNLYYIALPAAEGLQWDLYRYEPQGTTRAYGGPDWRPMYGCYRFKLDPGGEPTGAGGDRSGLVTLEPSSVIDGWNRAVEGQPHSWGPDPAEGLPQWIELRLRKPVEIGCVHVTFQLASLAARAYRIDVRSQDGAWKTVVAVSDNGARRRVHRFAPVKAGRVRIVIEKPGDGGRPPRICEVRVYAPSGGGGPARSP